MRKIQLGGNRKDSKVSGYVLVDDEDFEELCKYNWYKKKCRNVSYACRTITNENGERKNLRMHRVILKLELDKICDHINGNGLDNRKENLRICSHKENIRNRGLNRNNTSGYTGVYYQQQNKKWYARIMVDGMFICLGQYVDAKLASIAYRKAAKKYFGEFFYSKI